MATLIYPDGIKRNLGYWLQPANLWAARRKYFRRDNSLDWRLAMEKRYPHRSPNRSVPLSALMPGPLPDRFRIIVLGDTGEGDRSQYATLPLIRAMRPALIIINGDVAYPAGRRVDFDRGFFAPYKGLNVPIWATPGNHEYYSPGKGQEFFSIFCTSTFNTKWTQAGLQQPIPQPGTYFELKEPGGQAPPVVLIGLDTGQEGNLDGHGWGHAEDSEQHVWLRSRLQIAQDEGRRVVVLFHIPGLNAGTHEKKTSLTLLHRCVAEFDCVRLVICGHAHNYQQYSPDVFRAYLEEIHTAAGPRRAMPHYVVNGGGGAYLESTDYKSPRYEPASLFPEPADWREYASMGRQVLDRAGVFESAVGRTALGVGASSAADQDLEKYLSFLTIEFGPAAIDAVIVRLKDAGDDSFPSLVPDTAPVDVMDPNPPISQADIDGILAAGPRIPLWP